MTSTPVSNLAQAQSPPVLISKTGRLWMAILGVLMIAFHWHFLRRMATVAMKDADWSHILIIPLISVYYIHLHRQQLMATPRRVSALGLPFIFFGIIGYTLGIYPLQNDMAMGYSMIMTLFGVLLLLLGPAMMRVLWFPVAFLVFAVKVSPQIWSLITAWMQDKAATGAFTLLQMTSGLTGMYAELRGSTIDLDYGQANAPTPMNVAEACAGMRMLMAFLALGVALAFLFPRTWWQRLAMVALAAPIAIFVNALRVAVLGWMHLIDEDLAHGDSHLFIGMLMLIPAAGLLMLVGWCLDKIIITEGKSQRPPAPLPFDEDPGRVHLMPRPLIVGIALSAPVLIALVALEALSLYALSGVGVPVLFFGTFNLKAGLSSMLVHVAWASVAVFGWVGIAYAAKRWFKVRGQLSLALGVACGMLLTGLLVQASVIHFTGMALTKKALPLRHGIALNFPDQVGDWELLHQDPKEQKDVQDELGTEHYFSRYYVNNAAGVYAKDIELKLGDNGRLAAWSGNVERGNIARVHVAYYTGMLDTVPHVPDKCWIVAGNQLVYRAEHALALSRDDYRPEDPARPHTTVLATSSRGDEVRLPSDQIKAIVFSGESDQGSTSTALYFFLANGDAVSSSHKVRFSFNIQDRYSYYCKVEVMFPGVNDPQLVTHYAQDLLSDLLPEIMACLPDWTEVQAGRYPDTGAKTVK